MTEAVKKKTGRRFPDATTSSRKKNQSLRRTRHKNANRKGVKQI